MEISSYSVTQCLHPWGLTNMHCFPCKTFTKHFYYTFSILNMQYHVTFGTFVMQVLILVNHMLFPSMFTSLQLLLLLQCCIFWPQYYHLIIYQHHYSSQCLSHVVCPSCVTALVDLPPEPRNLLPSLTWGCLSSRCLSGQIRLSEEKTTLCLACWNFFNSSLGPEAKTTS